MGHGSVYFKGSRTGFFRQTVIKIYSRQHRNSDINVWLVTNVLTVFECSKSTSISRGENVQVSGGGVGMGLVIKVLECPKIYVNILKRLKRNEKSPKLNQYCRVHSDTNFFK